MCIWAGYFGFGDERALSRLLSAQANIYVGENFALGVRGCGCDSARLSVVPQGEITLTAGHGDPFTSVSIHPYNSTVCLKRNPFGQSSLYTTQIGSVVWFASEAGLLAQLPGGMPQLDAAALHGYLCFSYVPTPQTLITGVQALPAGEHRVIHANGAVHRDNQAAWQEGPHLEIDEEDAVRQLRQRLRESVAHRLDRAHEVGVFLSGGLDSSLVAALLVEAGAKLQLYTLDFGPPHDAELAYARAVAAHLRQPLHLVPARPADVRAALRPTAAALAQPFGDGVTVPLYLLAGAAARRVDVIFNGEGGDQLFGGWANKPMIAAELYRAQNDNREAAYLNTFHRLYGLTDQFYTASARQAVAQVAVSDWVRPALNAPGFDSLLHRLRAANLWLKGAQNIAPRVQQLAAAHGLSMHAPFFDVALAQWTFALPPDWFLRGACEKYLLKRAAEPYLPADIIWREKRGMGAPTTDWCLGPLRREIEVCLHPRRLRRAGWFEPDAIQKLRRGDMLLGDFRQRRVGEILWLLLMLHLWLEERGSGWRWPTHRKERVDEMYSLRA